MTIDAVITTSHTTNYMTTDAIRKLFIEFFKARGHQYVESSPLIPAGDNTLLFTNAGMVQFKDVFLGKEQRDYDCAVTCQKCVRAGGKHNDLENVGYTKRHHTFFEMLGNFSFGGEKGYFKREAIKYAWEFLTGNTEDGGLQLDPKDLWVTVHKNDAEAEKIWLDEMHVDRNRFSKCGDADNFWAMGETGPCGYCSEIYFDYGAKFAGSAPDGVNDTGDRYVEIWNLVFMEFERDAQGKLTPLAKRCIDTGMGLERIAAVMHRTRVCLQKFQEYIGDNYFDGARDYFLLDTMSGMKRDIGDGVLELSLVYISQDVDNYAFKKYLNSAKVIVDHLRAIVFLIADGLIPSNEDRGYVLRKIIRRAIRHYYLMYQNIPVNERSTVPFNKITQNLFIDIINKVVIELMSDTYPEIVKAQERIAEILSTEINKFSFTLENGERYFAEEVARFALKNTTIIPGAIAFRLYDTYGFPLDLTVEMAKERGLTVDMEGFKQAMEKQRDTSRAASKFGGGAMGGANALQLDTSGVVATNFVGYDQREFAHSKIVAMYRLHEASPGQVERVDYLACNEQGIVILDVTPFYAEAGGQIGDSGEIYFVKQDDARSDIDTVTEITTTSFTVENTQKYGNLYLHYGSMLHASHASDVLHVGQNARAEINVDRRQAITINHSAVHLMHKALRLVVGEHALQQGSLVDERRLRFDFAHFSALTAEELREIENIINREIRNNLTVNTEKKTLAEAKAAGALALFDEKYGDVVRVVNMGIFSHELCGGTHVAMTGEIGVCRIIAETGIAAGVRRIEAVTGANALLWFNERVAQLNSVATLLKTEEKQVLNRVQQLTEHSARLEKEIADLQAKIAHSKGCDLVAAAREVSDIKVLVSELAMEKIDVKILRQTLDSLKQQLHSAVIVLASKQDDKIQVVVGVTPDCVTRIKAGEIMRYLAPQIDGSGGGRADMAQGGGTNIAALAGALVATQQWIEEKLGERPQ